MGCIYSFDPSRCALCVKDLANMHYMCTCGDDYLPSTHPIDCMSCVDPHCQECNAPSTCSKCQDGYGHNPSGNCTQCQESLCLECPANYQLCTKCSLGAGPSSVFCLPCSTFCLECSLDSSTCTKCMPGYGLNPSHSCQSCLQGCLACPTSFTNCTQCQPNLLLQA